MAAAAAAASDRHVFDLFSGDVVAMRDNCNDDFEHAVLPAQGDQNRAPRISLVFKRALAGPDGEEGATASRGRAARAAEEDAEQIERGFR